MKIKKLTVDEALALLNAARALHVDGEPATLWQRATSHTAEEFANVTWEDEDSEFDYYFARSDNRTISLVGSSLFMVESSDEHETVQLELLGPMFADAEVNSAAWSGYCYNSSEAAEAALDELDDSTPRLEVLEAFVEQHSTPEYFSEWVRDYLDRNSDA